MAVLHKFRYTSSSNFGAPAANSLNISSDSERKKYNIKNTLKRNYGYVC
jgi:hypothetical protein